MRVNKIREFLVVLHDLADFQIETSLLRSCLALPKLSYILWTCPPGHIQQVIQSFDIALTEALEAIVGGPMSEWSWLKASLPSSRSGVNFRWASSHAPAAFIASSTSSQDLVDKYLTNPPVPLWTRTLTNLLSPPLT